MGHNMPLLYHELQESGLCGVHCLNTLFQGEYFGPTDLAEIGRSFDENERSLMMEHGETNDFLRYMAEDSGNVADDGFFSVQVLSAALTTFGLTLIPIRSEGASEAKQNPTSENAFICNLQEHWLTVRKINNQWFNFNSILQKPEFLSDFYLGAYLDTLSMEGYEIFVVKGELPQPQYPSEPSSNWKWIDGSPSSNIASKYQDELSKALQASMQGHSDAFEDDQELAAAIAASLQDSSTQNTEHQPIVIEDSEDELEDAILLSKQLARSAHEEKIAALPADQKTNLLIETPHNGSRIEFTFAITDSLQNVYDFLKANEDLPSGTYQFQTAFPREDLTDFSKTLQSLGLFPRAKVFLKRV